MKKVKKLTKSTPFKIMAFVLVLAFTFILRAHNYDREPVFGHLEEEMYAWSGLYTLEEGVPVSWSTLDYPNRAEVFRGKIDYYGAPPEAHVRLYKPWLDEPPLFSFLIGFFAHIYHANRHFIVPSSYIRMPIIFLSTITSMFVFLIASYISGFWIGILSMLLYGTIPIFVISSRYAVPENLIASFFSIMVYLLLRFEAKPSFKWLVGIPLLAGIAGLCKPTGYLIVPLAIYFALKKRYYKSSIYLLLATVPFFIAFLVYGVKMDSQIFWHLFSIQGQRPVGFASLAWFFSSPAYDINFFLDSWYVFSILCGFFFLMKPDDGPKKYVSLAFMYWIIVVMLTGGQMDLLPWYRIPAFPMLAILGAWGLEYLYQNLNLFTSTIAAGLLLGGRQLLVNAFRPDISPLGFRIIFSTLVTPSFLNNLFPTKLFLNLSKIVLIFIITVGIYFNIVFIYNQFELSCENLSCPLGPSTKLSIIYFPIIWKFFTLGPAQLK